MADQKPAVKKKAKSTGKKKTRFPVKEGVNYTTYKPELCDVLRHAATNDRTFFGTIFSICNLLDCSIQTYYNWRKEYPEFEEAVKYVHEMDVQKSIENLMNRANGQSKTMTKKTITRYDGTMQVEETEVTNPPDTQALKFLLTNRDPENWKDKMDVKQTGSVIVTFEEQDEGLL
jgi:hypothetical protein